MKFKDQCRWLREKKGLTVVELSHRAKVAKSTISKIENDKAKPTLDIAQRIAHALGTTLAQMLFMQSNPAIIQTPSDKQPIWLSAEGNERRAIAPLFNHCQFKWLHIRMAPSSWLNELTYLTKQTEKCYYVTKGQILIKIGYHKYYLSRGDSLYCEATMAHKVYNTSAQISEYFVVSYMK
jgi:transcriptional regulator with XRE-family HTH domain